ncbi:MAG: alpha/beta hydrolase [Desulfuromusa sp.]|nr:alpha/beta hydrolase [Desulfuromusa sp.]
MVMLVSFLLAGCAPHKTLTLMPTPVMYQNSSIDPFAHLAVAQKSTKTNVFFATNRAPKFSKNRIDYSNTFDSIIHLGKATIRMGGQNSKWDDLYESSLAGVQTKPIPLVLESTVELATMLTKSLRPNNSLTPELQEFVDSINSELAEAVDKEIMVYVHGTKVDFANSTILTAEIDYFAGRDFVGLAFAWPSHQNILYYLLGIDVRRALNSSAALQRLLVLLSEHTTAEHINILAYSAGGKVASKALYEMRQTYSDLDSSELKGKFRLGSVILAAADVSVGVFLERMPAISELANQVVVTVTDDDNALKAAKLLMGGEFRAGSSDAEKIEEDFIVSHNLSNVEIIDVSMGQSVRGFDIVGHHYWYRHPWMSSDIIFLMRTNLSPSRRGLSPSELEGIWYLSADYPEKIRKAVAVELEGQW